MGDLTKPLESAVRKVIDENLRNLGWKTNEFGANCNVFTERPRTKEEQAQIRKKFPKGKFPDYVLYSSRDFRPLAIIEAKRVGQSLEKALKQAKEYAECLKINVVFAIDGAIVEAKEVSSGKDLKIDALLVADLVNEKTLLRFVEEGADIFSPKEIAHTKQELIEIFAYVNDELRHEGMIEGIQRFTEFSNLLFLKLIDEIEDDRERNGERRRLDKRYCWKSFKDKPARDMMDYINDTVLPKLVDKYNGSGDVFQKELGIKNPAILKKIADKLSQLHLQETDSDVKGDAFEYFLKNSITVGNDLGEYFTPRHIVKLMVDFVDPHFGETVYDPCCGTGGFLIEAYRHIKKKCKPTSGNLKFLENKTIYGREITATAKISKMNMILAGDGHTHIREMDCLMKPINEKFDVILTNYPFAQKTEYGHLYKLNTTDGNPIFLKHVIDALKPDGRAGVVVPDSMLFNTANDYVAVRKLLIDTCTVEAVIQLNTDVFLPYTAQPTSLIFFQKKKATKKVWFFEVLHDGFKRTTSKKGRPASKEDDLPTLRALWHEKEKTDASFFIDAEQIKDSSYKLFMNFYKPRKPIKNPKTIGEICEEPILGGTPPKKDKSFYGKQYLWANISDMKKKEITDTEMKLSEKGKQYLTKSAKRDKSKEIKKGTLLMSFKLTLGKTAFAGVDLFTNEAICGLIPHDKEDKTIPEYLYYILPEVNYMPFAQRASMGLTLNKDLIPTVEIPFPPTKEERQKVIDDMKRLNEDFEQIKIRFATDFAKKTKEKKDYLNSEVL